MNEWIPIAMLMTFGCVLMVAELFLPAYGLIGLVGLGVVCVAVYRVFGISENAGVVSIGVLIVVMPLALIVSVRTWHRTWIGKRISPPNPVLTEQDRLPAEELKDLIGRTGRTATMLRPVGVCVFDGRRIECLSEAGVIAANVDVEAVRLVDRSLAVRPVEQARDAGGALTA